MKLLFECMEFQLTRAHGYWLGSLAAGKAAWELSSRWAFNGGASVVPDLVTLPQFLSWFAAKASPPDASTGAGTSIALGHERRDDITGFVSK